MTITLTDEEVLLLARECKSGRIFGYGMGPKKPQEYKTLKQLQEKLATEVAAIALREN